MTTATRAGQEQITQYLSSNPEFLENYVLSNVDLETVERWVIRKARNIQKENGGNYLSFGALFRRFPLVTLY